MLAVAVGRQEAIDAFLASEAKWRVVREDGSDSTVLEGPAVILGPTDKEYPFNLKMEVPRSFPNPGAHPIVRILHGPMTLGVEAHVGGSDALCVQMPPAHEIDYERDGLVGFFQQVLIHLRRSVIYALTGDYPGPAYAHGEAGEKEFREELVASFPIGLQRFVQPGLGMPPDNQWCPCGAPRRFKECHKPLLKKARAAYLEAGGTIRALIRDGRGGR